VTTEAKVELLNAREAAELLAVSRSHILKLARDGDIPSIRLGGTLRFRRDTIEEVLGQGTFQ
jgi:excisionase family DNA binding protein